MIKMEQALMKELEILPAARQADVLAFVRYLKLSLPGEKAGIEKRFGKALRSIRAKAKKLNISQEDVAAEIREHRAGNARRPLCQRV